MLVSLLSSTSLLAAANPRGVPPSGDLRDAAAGAGVFLREAVEEYTYIYRSGLQDGWRETGWGSTYNLAASPAGHAGSATIEVHIPNAWEGLALGDVGPTWTPVYHFFNTVTTLEFDVLIASDSTAHDSVLLYVGDGSDIERPSLTSLIEGWSSMSDGERFDQWHSVKVDLASLNPGMTEFFQIVFFKMSASGNPHFRLGDIRLGAITDESPPVISPGAAVVDYESLTLPFTADEASIYRIEYGYGDYGSTLTGRTDDWSMSHTPVLTGLERGQTLQYRIVAIDRSGNEGELAGTVLITDPPPPTTATVTITIDPSRPRPISPWIYGMNFYQSSSGAVRNLTLNRHGGNRWTAYNWENNASNAGADWYFHNDNYLGGGNTPGEVVRSLLAGDRARGNASLITVQLQGYVAADKNGDDVTAVADWPTRLATRFKEVVYRKSTVSSAPFTTTPSTTDPYVFMDEFVWAMDALTPGDIYSDPETPTFLLLDNEPDIWNSTHAEIQNGLVPVADFIAKSIDLCRAVKDVAPAVVVFGPVHYGFGGIYNWQGSPGFSSNYWFTDRYLEELKAASEADGRRLLDVYNFNWYSEATADGTRVTNLTGADLTEAQIQAIVQSPRSLWDETFTEVSWITQYITGGPINLLPRLQAKIDAIWAGTGLAITEWNNGGNHHIAGAIAVADSLGIFGQYGLFEASFWPLGTVTSDTFDGAGFRMFRDFDGSMGAFGDVSIPTVSSDTAKVSAYVSRDATDPARYVIVALNRSNASQAVAFEGLDLAGQARLFRLTGASATPSPVGGASIDLSEWILALPAYSITTIEVIAASEPANYAAWRDANFSSIEVANPAISAPEADPEGSGFPNRLRYAFALPARGPVQNPVKTGLASTGGGEVLTITFPRRTVATDLSYGVEVSGDLLSWSSLTSVAPDAPASVTIEDSTAPVSGAPRFLRVRVDLEP